MIHQSKIAMNINCTEDYRYEVPSKVVWELCKIDSLLNTFLKDYAEDQ